MQSKCTTYCFYIEQECLSTFLDVDGLETMNNFKIGQLRKFSGLRRWTIFLHPCWVVTTYHICTHLRVAVQLQKMYQNSMSMIMNTGRNTFRMKSGRPPPRSKCQALEQEYQKSTERQNVWGPSSFASCHSSPKTLVNMLENC